MQNKLDRSSDSNPMIYRPRSGPAFNDRVHLSNVTLVVAAFTLLFILSATAAMAQGRRPLSGSIPPGAFRAVPLGELPAAQNLHLAISLPLRNQAVLDATLQELYDPASPNYHHWLTSQEFTESFGPTVADVQKITQFAEKYGLHVEKIYSNRVVVDVSGPVGNIEKAFNVRMVLRKHPTENRDYFAPDVEPSVEEGVPILDVSGLDNFVTVRARHHVQAINVNGKMTAVSSNEQTVISNATGSSPGSGYMGNDFRAAYAPGVTLDGTGQTIGLFAFSTVCYSNDLAAYCATAGIPPVNITNVLLDGMSGTPNGDTGEQSLDVEVAHSMAPGAKIMFYLGNNTIDIFNAIASDNICKSASCSFGVSPPPSTLSTILQQMAAQGQSMFNACGDGGFMEPPFGWDDSPYMTQVGGTVLTTKTPGGPWASEDGWGGSGASISPNFTIPTWQQGINMSTNGGSTTQRNCPDVAMVSDSLYLVWYNGDTGLIGGTSASSPEWAGFMALVNQEAVAEGHTTAGFINPAIYSILRGTNSFSYASTFHDIATGSNGKLAVPGYDLVTGVGSPRGQALIDALARGTNTTPDFIVSASSDTVLAIQGGSGTNIITINQLGGFSSSVSLSASGLPSGVIASFNPSSTTSTSTLTLTASGTATPGTATVTITGVSGALSHFTMINLTVINTNANLNLGFETPNVGAGNYQYNLTNGSWNFIGNGAGIVANGSAFGNPNAPEGVQAAFLQSYGVISQPLAIFLPGTTYTITVSAAQRSGNNQNGGQSWNVMIDNNVIGSFNPGANPGANATSYADYTVVFTATAAIHTLSFVGTDVATGDNTVFIDNVRIVPTTAPDFSISTPPSREFVAQGSSLTNMVTINQFNGFDRVHFSVPLHELEHFRFR